MMASGGAIAPDELSRIVKSHPTASAVVLFLAFPNISGEELKMNGKALAKFVVVSGYNPGYKRLLTDHVIQHAIILIKLSRHYCGAASSGGQFDRNDGELNDVVGQSRL